METSTASPKSQSKPFFSAGIITGLITKSACAPFDRIRLLYQVQDMFHSGTRLQRPKYVGVWDAVRTIVREEGVRGLWRGNLANALRATFVYGIKFGANDAIKERMMVSQGTRELPFADLLCVGACAGTLQKGASYPLDVLSVRVALGVNVKTMGTERANYNGIRDCASRILRTEGPRGFYKGFGPTLLTGIPYVAFQMSFFDVYKRTLEGALPIPDGGKDHMFRRLLVDATCGSLTGLTAQTIVYPGDTVRKRMMANGVDGQPRLYNTSLDCARKIWHSEGLAAFYHGLKPSILKAVPQGAIQFATYGLLKSLVQQWDW